MSAQAPWLIFERGDACAALLFDPDTRHVILVEQFRPPTVRGTSGGLPPLGKGHGKGWLLETAAGMIKLDKVTGLPMETPEKCMIREIEEETGYDYQVNNLVPVASFFSSPGGTSERIHLFYAEVRAVHKVHDGRGLKIEGEDIDVVRMPLADFMRKLSNREFEDPKIIIAGQWLRERRQTEQATGHAPIPPRYCAVVHAPGRRIGFLTGDIAQVKGVADAWVNSENTDMMMDRFFDRSISGTIRRMGAKKHLRNERRVEQDTIADDLRAKLRGRTFVMPATVVETTSGELRSSNGVKSIFHVATVQGELGESLQTDLETLKTCVDQVLAAVEASKSKCKSVLIPMLGTGNGGFRVREVAPKLIERAVAYFETHRDSRIEKVVFLGYSAGDGDVLAEELGKVVAEKRLGPIL